MSVASYWYVACEFLGHRAAGIWPILISQMTQCSPKGPSTYAGRSQETQTGGSRHVLGTTCAHDTGSPHSLTSFLPNTPRHVYPQEQKHTCAHAAGRCTEHTLFCKSHVQISSLGDLTCLAASRLSHLESMAAPPVGKIMLGPQYCAC